MLTVYKNKRAFGALGERLVAQHLEQKGYTIVSQNYQKRYGEIDIIAQKKRELLFVEVKLRNTPYFDSAQLITPAKQKKIITVAKDYIARYTDGTYNCRFDVALLDSTDKEPQITYLPNAFSE